MAGLIETFKNIHKTLESINVDHALIGGFGLAAHGVHRATNDIDLLVDGKDRDKITDKLKSDGWKLVGSTPEVLHFKGVGLVDILLARRPLSKAMLEKSVVVESVGIKAVSAEALVGLKIQAYCNNPKRQNRDKADIQDLMRANPNIDMNEVKKYADLFDQWEEILKLKDNS